MVHYQIELKDEIKLRDNVNSRLKRNGFKKFAIELLQGWFPNSITKDNEHGVDKLRIINKITDFYHEFVKDLKTNKVIRNVTEKLSDHK